MDIEQVWIWFFSSGMGIDIDRPDNTRSIVTPSSRWSSSHTKHYRSGNQGLTIQRDHSTLILLIISFLSISPYYSKALLDLRTRGDLARSTLMGISLLFVCRLATLYSKLMLCSRLSWIINKSICALHASKSSNHGQTGSAHQQPQKSFIQFYQNRKMELFYGIGETCSLNYNFVPIYF